MHKGDVFRAMMQPQVLRHTHEVRLQLVLTPWWHRQLATAAQLTRQSEVHLGGSRWCMKRRSGAKGFPNTSPCHHFLLLLVRPIRTPIFEVPLIEMSWPLITLTTINTLTTPFPVAFFALTLGIRRSAPLACCMGSGRCMTGWTTSLYGPDCDQQLELAICAFCDIVQSFAPMEPRAIVQHVQMASAGRQAHVVLIEVNWNRISVAHSQGTITWTFGSHMKASPSTSIHREVIAVVQKGVVSATFKHSILVPTRAMRSSHRFWLIAVELEVAVKRKVLA
mmetsp:Transcript_52425/g.131812  ORF Transcript_52425/g.131812 Transcript_52425/m.131812 type:complete len:279 (+) Transcript_52425:143-979(+)